MDANKLLEQLDLAMKQLTVLRDLIVFQRPALPSSIADEAARGICHKCKLPLGDKKPVRGCHSACNQEMNRMKTRKEVTDEELMAIGWIGPPAQSGRKRKTTTQDLRDAQERATELADRASPLAQKKQKKSDGSKS